MGFSCGLLGLPNAGKTTLFNALSRRKAKVASHPFTTIEPNIAEVPVPDRRLELLQKILRKEKMTPTVIEIRDVAGLVKGASLGEGLGNKFLGDLREVDALLHVVRCFEEAEVSHVYTTLDPLRDIDMVFSELAVADLEVIDKRLERVKRDMKSGEKKAAQEHNALLKAKDVLGRGQSLRAAGFDRDTREVLAPLALLTDKPLMYVANADEGELGPGPLAQSNARGGGKYVPRVTAKAGDEGVPCIMVSAKLEDEMGDMEESEREGFLKDMGLAESGLDRLIHAGYELLSLVTFYTLVGKELRAWTITIGTRAQDAAGKIHSDMARGFIKADVINYEDFIRAGSEISAREKGLIRSEGKDYIVKDGDILHIKF